MSGRLPPHVESMIEQRLGSEQSVLAVMDRDRRLLSGALAASDRSAEILREHDAARDAMAELIEASKDFKFEAARIANADARKKAKERLESALARVGGKP